MKRQLIVLDLVHRSPFAGRVQSSGPTNRNQIVLVLVVGLVLEGLVRGSPFTGQSNVKRASSAVAL